MPLSALAAGFIAILVGYGGSAAIVFQAASVAGADAGLIGSWMGALGIGMGVTTIALSLKYRAPVVTAWSTPGAAMLVVALVGVDLSAAVGAFLFSGALVTLAGYSGWFERIMDRVPLQLASAMLAGVLARFGMDVFVVMQSDLALVLPMFAAYLLVKRLSPRYVVILVLFLGMGLSALYGLFRFESLTFALARPVYMPPSLDPAVILGVGVPLFLVTMASQNIPGVAVLRTYGYDRVPVSPVVGSTGLVTLLMAPFGGFAYNLAAITAAICAGPDAHPDRERRYLAGVAAGLFYLVAGILGGTVAALFIAFPDALVIAIAGIALLGTITSSLQQAMDDSAWREPALITFLVTLSGVDLYGVGSAFWGLVAGALAMWLLGRR